jgi:NAD(P)H-dependent flavin oxidoreductase YrpB (nitropropane dioxygenase family)
MGQGAGAIEAVMPAGDVVRQMAAEAEEVIATIARFAKAS